MATRRGEVFLREIEFTFMASEVDKLLERAKRAIEKNKPADAIAAYQSALQVSPGNVEAMQALGDLYTHQQDPGKAAVYYGMLFDRLVESRDESKATALYTRFLRLAEQPPERQAKYALLLQRQNKTGEAIEHYSLAAERFLKRGKDEEALKCIEQVAELDPEDADRQIALAELAEKRGRGALAAKGYVRAGQLALVKGEMQKAVARLACANLALPEDRDTSLLYANVLLMSNEAALAVATLEPFAQTENTVVFQKSFGEALLRAGQLERARGQLENYYKTAGGDHALLFQLAEHLAATGQDAQAVEVLTEIRERYKDSSSEGAFAAQLDRIAEANPRSLPIIEFWSVVYSGLNREARYFEVLVHLFDAYLEHDDIKSACDVLDRMVDIDPYDYRNQQRLERLSGQAEQDYLLRLASRIGVTLSQPGGDGAAAADDSSSANGAGASATTTLDDLLVQAEIFLQYSLQPKAIERLQKVVQMFPAEIEGNARYRGLCDVAGWWPEGVTPRAPGEVTQESPGAAATAPAAAQSAPSGVYTAETMRDLAKIAEIGQNVYRQTNPRAMLAYTVNEIGKHLRASRCLAVVGEQGQPPQMAAEYCAAGMPLVTANQVLRIIAQLERAAPDSMGGLPLDAAAAPVLKEIGLATALGVSLTDKETQAPAGIILAGHAEVHKWKPNETYFLQTVGDQMLISVSHTRLRSLVQTMNAADQKTGLLARSAYADRLLGEAQRAKTQDASLSVAILQIDSGPELIRQQGEALVDKYFEQVSHAVLPLARATDLAVKYTAWSLAFILPDTTLAGALGIVEKMRVAVANGRKENAGSPAKMTVSAGVVEAIARVDYDTEDIVTDLINRAESSLEEARKRGGDAVVSLTNSGA
jgi:diguanylate cyclase (GGDEF)-like protein